MTQLSKVVRGLEEITYRCESIAAIGSVSGSSADIKEQLEEICANVCELEGILVAAEKITPGIQQITKAQFDNLKDLLERGKEICQTSTKDKST